MNYYADMFNFLDSLSRSPDGERYEITPESFAREQESLFSSIFGSPTFSTSDETYIYYWMRSLARYIVAVPDNIFDIDWYYSVLKSIPSHLYDCYISIFDDQYYKTCEYLNPEGACID